jgi:hypothetical protein
MLKRDRPSNLPTQEMLSSRAELEPSSRNELGWSELERERRKMLLPFLLLRSHRRIKERGLCSKHLSPSLTIHHPEDKTENQSSKPSLPSFKTSG